MLNTNFKDYYDNDFVRLGYPWRRCRRAPMSMSEQLGLLNSFQLPVPLFGTCSQLLAQYQQNGRPLAPALTEIFVEVSTQQLHATTLSSAAHQFPYCTAYVVPTPLDEQFAGHRVRYIGVGDCAWRCHSINPQFFTPHEREASYTARVVKQATRQAPEQCEPSKKLRPLHLSYAAFVVDIAYTNNFEGGVLTAIDTTPVLAELGLPSIVNSSVMANIVHRSLLKRLLLNKYNSVGTH